MTELIKGDMANSWEGAWSTHVFTVNMIHSRSFDNSKENAVTAINPFTQSGDWKLSLPVNGKSLRLEYYPTCSIRIESLEPANGVTVPFTIKQAKDFTHVTDYANYWPNGRSVVVTVKFRVDADWISMDRLRSVQSDYADLLFDDDTKDIIFKIGDENIRAHKLIVCSRVPAFKAMFASGMQEAETNCATIEDTEPNAFHHLLKFIYTGKLPLGQSIDEVAAVLILAEKYDLGELKKACVDILSWGLDKDCIVDVWLLAQTYNCPELDKACRHSFLELKSTMDDQAWNKLKENPDLMVDIIKKS